MISTRQHAVFDYCAAGMAALLSCSRLLPPRTRTVLATAAAATAALATQTGYEGGLRPRLPMRAHLALDLLAGASLCTAALRLRRQPLPARALLLAFGAAGLTTALRTSPHPATGPRTDPGHRTGLLARLSGAEETMAYLPLDTPKPAADNVWTVDSLMSGPAGAPVPIRMTVLRLPDGTLLLHSPVPHTPALDDALRPLGPIAHLVAPNSVHWLFLRDWQRAHPTATTWATPGLRDRKQVRRAALRLDRDLTDGTPPEWGGAVELTTIPAGLGLNETAMFHRPTRTLLLTDLVLNFLPSKLPAPVRPLFRLLGVTAPDAMPPPWARAVFLMRRKDAAAAAESLLRQQPERVVFAHGDWFAHDATPRLRHAWRWLLD